jgi:serine/threonine protein kinase
LRKEDLISAVQKYMETDFQKEVTEIVLTAIEQTPEVRKIYLEEVCRGKPEMRREIEALLAADSQQSILEADSVFDLASIPPLPNFAMTETNPVDFSDSVIGQVLENRYVVTEKIGEGGMGYVFKAEDRKLTNRLVVVKFLKPEILNQAYLINKFRHEMEALARVKNEGVIDIYDIGTLDGVPYLITEYFDGSSLDKIISPTGMPFPAVAEIMKKIGRALTEVHRTGIIHRDLKPSNILVKYTPREITVKIIDFGVARVEDSVISSLTTQLGRTLGTAQYISPEQLLGGENLTSATDIFSLGVISYQMLTGKLPFEPSNILQLPEMHRQGVSVLPRTLRPEISVETQNIILKALAYEASARFQNASNFGDDLAQSLTQVENSADRSGQSLIQTENFNGIASSLPSAEKTASTVKGGKLWKSALLGLLLTLLIVGFGVGIFMWNRFFLKTQPIETVKSEQPTTAAPITPASRNFKYSLLVQPTEKNREPFIASPMQTFLGGWRFRMQFDSSQNGYLYLLNESSDTAGNPSLAILFPDPRLNDGKAQVMANQSVTTNQYEFANAPGLEKFWIVWSAKAVPELEAVKGLVNPQDLGKISDKAQSSTVQNFLKRHDNQKTSVKESGNKQNVSVEGEGDVIVTLSELRHN